MQSLIKILEDFSMFKNCSIYVVLRFNRDGLMKIRIIFDNLTVDYQQSADEDDKDEEDEEYIWVIYAT